MGIQLLRRLVILSAFCVALMAWPFFLIYCRRRKRRLFIIASPYGQLGNRLVLYSHVSAYALQADSDIANCSFLQYSKFFASTKHDLFCRFPKSSRSFLTNWFTRKVVHEIAKALSFLSSTFPNQVACSISLEDIFFDKAELHLRGSEFFTNQEISMTSLAFQNLIRQRKVVFLNGWRYRDRENLLKHGDHIRKFFEPVPKVLENVNSLVSIAKGDADLLIGIHQRGSDYLNWIDGRFYYDQSVYTRKIGEIVSLFPKARLRFLICTDSQIDAANIPTQNFVLGSGDIAEDLFSLARCDFIVGPPSTYSGWAAFYGKVPLYFIFEPDHQIALTDFKVPLDFPGIEIDVSNEVKFIL